MRIYFQNVRPLFILVIYLLIVLSGLLEETYRVYFMFCVHWKLHPFHEHLEDEDKLATGNILPITLPDIQVMH